MHAAEVSTGKRFRFGANWAAFLRTLDEDRIHQAELSLKDMLTIENLAGKRFLDVGSGSGLFSLAARRLGAEVHSLDYDPDSVACTRELKRRYFNDDPKWTVEEASVLDESHLRSLGKFDVVYSWGVLHHTGQMQRALNNVIIPLADSGKLFISIYNDQGTISKFWTVVKRIYCSGLIGRIAVCSVFIPYFIARGIAHGLHDFKNPFASFSNYRKQRGMSPYHDWIDWLGGYPFEVAKPEHLLEFYKPHHFTLDRLITTNNLACNQFVFKRESQSALKAA
ncbi:MAG: class I SAM-dependent methyltransferase [Planctomycetota bacterium]